MTLLSANRSRRVRNTGGLRLGEITGVDSDEFYAGGLLSLSAAAATVMPSADTSLQRFVGVTQKRTTTGSSNTTKIRYEYGHEEWFAQSGIVTGQEQTSAYVLDDATVTDYEGSTNKVRVGPIRELETIDGVAGVWVYVDGMALVGAGVGRQIAGNTMPVRQWNHAGEGVISARGDDAVSVAGTIYYGGWVPDYDQTVTNINILNGTVVGTDDLIVGIYSLAGVLLRSSALAGTLSAGADAYQAIALTATLGILGGVEYLVAAQVEGTTAQIQRAQTGFRAGTGRAGSQTGVFGTMATISSVATAFATAKAPLFFVD